MGLISAPQINLNQIQTTAKLYIRKRQDNWKPLIRGQQCDILVGLLYIPSHAPETSSPPRHT